MNSFFSIIIPSFNSGKTIVKSVRSILNQSYQDFEIVIVDDGSTDNTAELVTSLADTRIHYLRQPNAGAAASRNSGAECAKGQYFIFLDADDWLSEGYLTRIYEGLSSENYQLALGFIAYTDGSGRITQNIAPWKGHQTFAYPICGAFAISKNLFRQLGGYDPNLSYSENTDLFLRVELGKLVTPSQIVLIPEAGVLIGPVNKLQRNLRYRKKKYDSMKYFLEKHKDFFNMSKKYFILFKRIHAVCAAENNEFNEARKSMRAVIQKNPFSLRDYMRYLFFCLPFFAKRRYQHQ